MNFYDGKEDNEKIIRSYFSSNKYIKVNYLNRDCSITYNYTKEKQEEINNIMISQALERDKELFDTINQETKIYFSNKLLSLLSIILSFKGELPLLLCVSFIAYVIASKEFDDRLNKLKELKKFRLYYSMKDELTKKENKDITKIIEAEAIYRDPINIGTLDNFSLNDVKTIKKELVRKNK